MSRSRKNSDKESLEQLRSENRKLKAEIDRLQKRLDQESKPKKEKLHKVKDITPDLVEPALIDQKQHKCVDCGRGNLVKTELGANRILIVCDLCAKRKTVKL